MPDKDTSYQAEWTDTLRYRPDPNRVDLLQPPPRESFKPHPDGSTSTPPAAATLDSPSPRAAAPAMDDREAPSYYDVSILKKPVWKWHIASYFYLGGMSAGAYLLARAADRAGGAEHRGVTRAGTWLSLAAVAPCPALLIADLGDPKRFHHMLRVFKPGSPMNFGTWTLVGYSGMVAAAALRELLRERGGAPEERGGPVGKAGRGWLAAHDLAGVPLATTVAGYTGVLLSCTSNPLWCKNPWLGPLFSASSLSTGAEAISLALDCTTSSARSSDRPQRLLQKVDTAAHAAEGAAMAGFSRFAGEKAKPLRKGKMRNVHKFALGALVASEAVKLLPISPRYRKPVRVLAAAAGLAAGFAMRWSMVHGGKQAAEDPHTARLASRPEAAGSR